jgi:hypothetical protein
MEDSELIKMPIICLDEGLLKKHQGLFSKLKKIEALPKL